MHDPKIVAFQIRRPWPNRERHGRKPDKRWKLGWPFMTLAGSRLYWPPMVTVWHNEPGGQDALTVCRPSTYQRHVHHWSLQIHPLQDLRRRVFQRCEWCNGPSRKGDAVNISHQWHMPSTPWWVSRRGIYHADCSSVEHAHTVCVCAPRFGREREKCLNCGKRIPAEAWLPVHAALAAVPKNHRPTPEVWAAVQRVERENRARTKATQ